MAIYERSSVTSLFIAILPLCTNLARHINANRFQTLYNDMRDDDMTRVAAVNFRPCPPRRVLLEVRSWITDSAYIEH